MNDREYYRQRIIELINGVNSSSTLKYICTVIESYLKGRGNHEPNR